MEESNDDKGFFIALPSNTIHPSRINRTSHYFMSLPSKLILQGLWEVALVEVTIPVSWYNVPDFGVAHRTIEVRRTEFNYIENTGAIVERADRVVKESIPYGNYENVNTLVSTINSVLKKIDDYESPNAYVIVPRAPYFTVQQQNLKPKLIVAQGDVVVLPNGLAKLLKLDDVEGSEFRDNNQGRTCYPGDNVSNASDYLRLKSNIIDRTVFKGYAVPEVNYSTNLYIYSNIVEKQLVGDVYVPLLRSIPCTLKFGEIMDISFSKPYYKKVVKSEINEIEIQILDHAGTHVRFEYGTVLLILHFRKR